MNTEDAVGADPEDDIEYLLFIKELRRIIAEYAENQARRDRERILANSISRTDFYQCHVCTLLGN